MICLRALRMLSRPYSQSNPVDSPLEPYDQSGHGIALQLEETGCASQVNQVGMQYRPVEILKGHMLVESPPRLKILWDLH